MSTPLKYTLIFFTAPVWLPFLVIVMMLATTAMSSLLLAIV